MGVISVIGDYEPVRKYLLEPYLKGYKGNTDE